MKIVKILLTWLSANFFFVFKSLLTAFIVKNNHNLAGIDFIFLENCPRPNFKDFQYQICTSMKRLRK